jgi:hypothetical protein
MKKFAMPAIICAFAALAIAGCGGGGGAATKAVTKVLLFGTMSSSTVLSSVQTRMTVPSALQINYSSAFTMTNYSTPHGIFPLRSGAVVPSGPVKIPAANITGSYNNATHELIISMVNPPGGSQVAWQCSTTGNKGKGEEIATINFKLAKPVALSAIPAQDPTVTVGKYRASPVTSDYLNGCVSNYDTTFQ